jgi:hypothetical protein
MAHQGIGTFRANLNWNIVEPRRGLRDWSAPDRLVRRVALARMSLLPVLIGSPRFAARRRTFPPRSAAARRAWAVFVRDAVGRYGPGGRFWEENPDLPYRPARAWQVWNEPNFSHVWWGGNPDPRGYVSFVALTRRALQSRDRGARIVLAGIPEVLHRGRRTMYWFIRSVYRIRGSKRLFDVVAVHPYTSRARGVPYVVGRVRSIMRRAGDGRTPLWVTEFGWATGSPDGFLVTTPSGQAARLRSAYRGLLRIRRRHRVGLAAWFSWRDRAPAPGQSDWWGINTGLFQRDGEEKPAWQAYGDVTGAASR